MSPGTFYGRPGEVPTFINAAVGAPLTLRVDGDDGDASEGAAAQTQEEAQTQRGQWYHQNQTHGAYFYAMSSPKRKTPTGMEPKGYFDPLYFPAGVNAGYTSSVSGRALVNEIMKDGRAQSLGVEVGVGEDEGSGRGEEETRISDDGNDENDSGDDDADGDVEDDDDSGEEEEEEQGEENQEAHDTCPPSSEDEDDDRRLNKGALLGSSGESSISRTQSLPASDVPHQHQQHS